MQARWGTVDLLDILAEADHHVGLVRLLPVGRHPGGDPGRACCASGCCWCCSRWAPTPGSSTVAGGDHGHSEAALRHVRRLHVTRDNLRRAIATLVNATLAARDPALWGTARACASDSKKFGSWESNLMTEWHARYRGPGVMIYWHVETGRLCVYSQLKLLVLRGRRDDGGPAAPRHRRAEIEANYVDTHGASASGSPSPTCSATAAAPAEEHRRRAALPARCRPRRVDCRHLTTVLTRPIRWELIAQQYDQMVKYATALRLRHRRGRADPAPLHPPRPAAPHLRRPRRARPRGQVASSSPATCARKRCAARSTTGCRWSRTGTPPTTPCSTARTAS